MFKRGRNKEDANYGSESGLMTPKQQSSMSGIVIPGYHFGDGRVMLTPDKGLGVTQDQTQHSQDMLLSL